MTQTFDALAGLKKLCAQLKDLRARAGLTPALAEALAAPERKAAALETGAVQGAASGRPAPGTAPAPADFGQLHSQLATLYNVLQQADAAPTTQAASAAANLRRRLAEATSLWNELKGRDVDSINAQLRTAGLPPLTL